MAQMLGVLVEKKTLPAPLHPKTTHDERGEVVKGEPTGVLTIEAPGRETEQYLWNGVPEERAAAKERFDELMSTRTYFAYVETSPGKSQQVRTFGDVEKIEKDLGLARVTIQPALQGG